MAAMRSSSICRLLRIASGPQDLQERVPIAKNLTVAVFPSIRFQIERGLGEMNATIRLKILELSSFFNTQTTLYAAEVVNASMLLVAAEKGILC